MFILRILIQTNLFIAIAAVCFMLCNALLLDLDISQLGDIALLVFSSTWLIYQFSRWLYFKKNAYSNESDVVFLFLNKYPKLNLLLIFIATVLMIISVLFIHNNVFYFLAILGCISFLYPISIMKIKGKWYKLREIPFIKLFLIAFVWSTSCVLLPVLEFNSIQNIQPIQWLLFVIQFVFILFITLPFDMNDAEIDKSIGVKTIPSIFGIQRSNQLLIILLIVLLLLWFIFFFYFQSISIRNSIIFIIFVIFNSALAWYATKKITTISKEQVKYIFDGSMIVQFILTFLVYQWM